MGDSFPLNQLLFGPPGTGKTYRTAEVAVEICDGTAPNTREATMQRYKALRDAGRVAFVTFHQSYGYEEFVEGIRPVLAEDDNQAGEEVRFECRPGVFKRLCASATALHGAVRRKSATIDPANVTIWKMSLGNTQDPDNTTYEEAIDGNYLALGWGEGLDFTGCDSRAAIFAKLQTKKPEVDTYAVTAVHAFKNKMKVGDIVVISDGNHKFRAVGRVAGEYQPPTGDDPDQHRAVEWLATFEPSLPQDRILNRVFSQATIYELKPAVLKLAELNALLQDEADDGPPKNHVLIIDEINRGNISKILGELITLLEPDKRIGRENELYVTLPHSGETFGVPQNVYLIGTMNTADRSIAFLDTALRRRFEFIELMPDPLVVKAIVGVKDGVDVAQLLTVLNQRIELLYDRDHTLGHAFFLGVKSLDDLRAVFVNKVIPLLQEYFYGDWGKLCQVLGCPYDPDSGKPRSKNESPIITTTLLDPGELLADSDAAELRVHCTVNPKFLSSKGAALRPFFDGVWKKHAAEFAA